MTILKKITSYFTLTNGILLLALVVALLSVIGTVDALQKNFALQQKVDSLQQEITIGELANDTLRFQNRYYQSNEYLELSAREHLNKATKDEKLLVLPQSNRTTPPDGDLPPAKPLLQRSNLEQWMYFLFGTKE